MNQNIYDPPKSELREDSVKRQETGKVISIIGAVLQVPVIVCFLIGLIDFVQFFQSLVLYGEGDEKVIVDATSAALSYFVIGVALSTPGLIVSIVSLYISTYRSKWLLRYLILTSVFWIVSFPFGTLFGFAYLVIILIKRKTSTTSLNQSMRATTA